MSEKDHLLATDSDDSKSFKNDGIDRDSVELLTAMKAAKDQACVLTKLQEQLNTERNKNMLLESKLDLLSQKFETFLAKYSGDMEKKNKEIEKIEIAVEARQELQNSVIDELKFQLQTVRKKLENTTNKISETKSNSNLIDYHEDSSKKPLRKFSNDSAVSNGSNPNYIHRICTSHHGQTVWRINSFAKKLKKISSGTYDEPSRSETFLTGPNGYRLSLWAYLNGRGKFTGKSLSVFIRVVASEFDAILTWPIRPCYTFCLINQDTDSSKRLDLVRVRDLSIKHNGISRPQRDDKSFIVGFDDFISHEDLEKKNFLVDDTLFLKCTVEIPQLQL